MSLDTLHDLFLRELRDLYDAERQLLVSLPLLAQAANAASLRRLFHVHVEETRDHRDRLARVLRAFGEHPEGKDCLALQGLVGEAREMIQEDVDPLVLDAALIVVAQKVKHYGMAGYASARAFARKLGYHDVCRVLDETLREASEMNEKLTRVAETRVNHEAAVAVGAEA